MNTLKLKNNEEPPSNYTGIVEWENGDKCWMKKRIFHRIDGPAIEYSSGHKEWCVEGNFYSPRLLLTLIESTIYLGTEKGNYNLYWLKFLTEDQGIKEYPLVPGMEKDKPFQELFNSLRNQTIGATSP